ncbi:hypothetical protein BDP27DRAFT_1417413 [Rhodocollybia butyracea]|uniref:Uncharacterized protein n=1 Tax=Rhodocollybia butyracea TaxID=206335 RepID=A0A9P5PVM0_9AGAR|nr:hypothetical protein BDP27DRAFT_1417413 [Rhodocollybia butyracea]
MYSFASDLAETYGTPLIALVPKLAILMVMSGVFVLGTCIAIKPLIASSSKPKITLLLCLILSFLSYAWNMTDIIVTAFQGLRVPERVDANLYDVEVGFTSSTYQSIYLIQSIPGTVNLLLSDLIVVWRAWILFPRSCFWRATLVTVMTINIGVNIADCIADTDTQSTFATSGIASYFSVFDWISIVMSLSVNVVTTSLVGWKVWGAITYGFNTQTGITVDLKSPTEFILGPEGGQPAIGLDLVDIVTYLLIVVTHNIQAFYPITVAILIHNTQPLITESLHYQSQTNKLNDDGDVEDIEDQWKNPA